MTQAAAFFPDIALETGVRRYLTGSDVPEGGSRKVPGGSVRRALKLADASGVEVSIRIDISLIRSTC
jgi:hypothetical protein